MTIAVIAAATATVCAAAIITESAALANGDVLDDVYITTMSSDLSVAAIAVVVGAVSDAV